MRSCNAIQPLKQISIHCNTFTPMRKEFGKWLMDIAKYMMTALLLSSVFGDMSSKKVVIIVIAATIATLIIGLFLVRNKPKLED